MGLLHSRSTGAPAPRPVNHPPPVPGCSSGQPRNVGRVSALQAPAGLIGIDTPPPGSSPTSSPESGVPPADGVHGGGGLTSEQSALARRRLRLGITNVGFWVITAVAGLVELTTPGSGLAAIHPWAIALGVLGVQAVFDGLGGWILMPPPARECSTFLRRWIRGVAVHSLVLVGIGSLGALSLRWTGGFGAGLAVSMFGLAFGRGFLHRTIIRAPLRPEIRDGGAAVLFQAVDDPAFTGGIIGLGRRAEVLLPESWRERLPRPELEVELFRRRWQIGQALHLRAFLMLLFWNLAGSLLGTIAFDLTARPTDLALIGHACWMTLWTFISLLVLPALSRAVVLAADRGAAESDLDAGSWIRRFPGITGEDGNPRAVLQNIFYPIPAARIRLRSLAHPHSRFVAGNLARNNLYYSWAAFTPLGRAVHCNVGRPALWVFPPSA